MSAIDKLNAAVDEMTLRFVARDEVASVLADRLVAGFNNADHRLPTPT